MPKHIFFDLDNTLMMSRTTMMLTRQPLFKTLCDQRDVIVVSGASESQIKTQIPDSIGARFYVLAQTGNHALDKAGRELWKESFTKEQTDVTLDLIETFKKELDLAVKDGNDLVELRGSQISYSPIGHHEDLQKKYAFDPRAELRKRMIRAHLSEIVRLNELGVDVVPGGTTCFDFFLHGRSKGFNVNRLLKHEGWRSEECVYVGDALFPGGNDETVIGIVPTVPVANPDETFTAIKQLLEA
ncbi:MAG TPA: HAD-IIB family hydrolase [Candidatus Paceibacterota bacterium]